MAPPAEGVKLGDVVTFSYSSLSQQGQPIFPQILHVKSDISWTEMTSTYTGAAITYYGDAVAGVSQKANGTK